MKAIRKPILIVISALAVGCLIVFSGLSAWIGSSSGRHWLQSRIDTVIAGTVTIDDIRLSLIAPRLELAGVTLYDPQGTKVAGVDHFSISLRWLPLLRREVRITNIDLKNPWANLIQDKAAGLNLMAAVAVRDSEKTGTSAFEGRRRPARQYRLRRIAPLRRPVLFQNGRRQHQG